MIGHGDGFLKSFRFVVDTSRTDGVHVPKIFFVLRMNLWISVDFTGGGDGDPCPFVLGQSQAIVHPQGTHLQGLNGNFKVIDRRGRRCEVQDVVQFSIQVDVLCNVVVMECEVRVLQ